jgi:hypothetical protein
MLAQIPACLRPTFGGAQGKEKQNVLCAQAHDFFVGRVSGFAA